MEIQTEETDRSKGRAPELPPSGGSTEVLWDAVGTLYRRRGLITSITLVALIASVVIALLTPKWYAAEARVLQPEGGGLSLLGIVNRASGGLGNLLGGGGGGYERYLTILTSRSMMESVVEAFDLVEIYEIDEEDPYEAMFRAADELSDNVSFDVALKFDYLAIVAFDKDPERAAEMSNFMVAKLNEENARLSSETARRTRSVIEQRLNRAVADMDSARAELQAFQETNGLVQLEAQAEAMMQSIASLKAEAAKLDIQYQTLAQQYGPDNPQVQAARQARNAAQAEIRRTLGGRDDFLPVAMRNLPALTNRYARLMQDQLIQQQILETVYPIYEQALFQEQSEAEAVQVIDDAVPPVLAARPSRRLIVIGTTLTALIVACVYVLLGAWLKANSPQIARRLNGVRAS